MKLIRFGPTDLEKPGLILSDGRYIDVSDVIPDYDESFFTSGQIQELKDYVDSGAISRGRSVYEARSSVSATIQADLYWSQLCTACQGDWSRDPKRASHIL